MFADDAEVVTEPLGSKDRGSLLRYLRFASLWAETLRHEFVNVRFLLEACAQAGIAPWIHMQGSYRKVQLAEPYVNYCYMQLPMPPNRANLLEDPTHCVLPGLPSKNESGLTGQALSFEESMLGWEEWADNNLELI